MQFSSYWWGGLSPQCCHELCPDYYGVLRTIIISYYHYIYSYKNVLEQGTWEISNLSFRAAIGPLMIRPRGGASPSYVYLMVISLSHVNPLVSWSKEI